RGAVAGGVELLDGAGHAVGGFDDAAAGGGVEPGELDLGELGEGFALGGEEAAQGDGAAAVVGELGAQLAAVLAEDLVLAGGDGVAEGVDAGDDVLEDALDELGDEGGDGGGAGAAREVGGDGLDGARLAVAEGDDAVGVDPAADRE